MIKILLQENGDQNVSDVSRGTIITPEKPGPSRWRKVNIIHRKKYKSVMKRNLGHSYISSRGKNIDARVFGAPCSCKKRCRTKLNGTEKSIFDSFWNLGNYEKQNTYLFGSVKSIPKKRSYKKKTKRQESSRKVTFIYTVKVNGVDTEICKKEFLAVHGLQHSQKRLRNICRQISAGRSTSKPDERGKHHNRPNKLSIEQVHSVHDHIKAFPKYVSHYSRQNNPNRVYLNHDINISILYKDFYVTWCKEQAILPVKEDRYRRIFCTEYNIGFKLPKVDTCATCDELNNLIEANKENEQANRNLKSKLELHQRRAKAMQDDLKHETAVAKENPNKIVISFDLQQTLPTPHLTVGQAFYLRKAWTYNLGIHDCATGQASMFMWTEDVAKRGSEEIASCLLKYLTSRSTTGEEEVIIYTDNCGGQNKNWVLMMLWLQLVRENRYNAIEHRFLVSGHTYLPSDRDFAVIEKHKKFLKQIYCPEQWYEAVSKSRRINPFTVIVMRQEDFVTFESIPFAKKKITEEKEPVKFNQIRCFRFESKFPNIMFIKHILNEASFQHVNIGKRGNKISGYMNILGSLPKKYLQPIELNSKKIKDLKKLLKYIPPVYQDYYRKVIPADEGETVLEEGEGAAERTISEDYEEAEVENVDGEDYVFSLDDGLD